MKYTILILLLAATVAANAQTPAKSSAPVATVPKASATTAHSTTASSSGIKLPPGVPPAKGVLKTAFSLRYQDVKIGTGADAQPNKMYKVFYTGWLAADGRKFDSTDDHHRLPTLDKDGKPVLGADGKPVVGPPQPISFPQGFGRVIPGWDQSFGGMKIGGKRRVFIPWQLAYGARGRPGPDAAHPGIPPMADLIFDIELVDVADMPTQPNRPPMGATPGGNGPHPGMPPTPPAPSAAASPAKPAAPATPSAAPAAPSTPAAPAAPATPSAAPAAPATPAAPAQPQSK